MKRPRFGIEFAERPTVEIPRLRPTQAENALWAAERPRHARIAFAKFGLVPGIAMAVGAIASRGSHHHHWWLWLILLGVCGGASVLSWLSMWRLVEEPKLRLKALRATRLLSALAEERDDSSDEPYGAA